MWRRILLSAAGICVAGMWLGGGRAAAQGDVPQVTNGKLEIHEAGPNAGATIRKIIGATTGPVWIGYGVDGVPENDGECCSTHRAAGSGGVYRLEAEKASTNSDIKDDAAERLENKGRVWVLFRGVHGHVEKIQMVSAQCRLDAGGLQLMWLKDVNPVQSVAFLSEFVKQGFAEQGEQRMGETALTAIAVHADAAADRALEVFVGQGQPERLRERASFWMGATRGAAGFAALKQMARREPSSDVRAQVSFALFVSNEPGATDEMIRMAREDESSRVRGQALFWLAQKAGQKAERAITGAIADDPDTEVKKKAVFALSQMPKDEGVPKLIEVAEKNKNPEVRKQAMFWLGQTGDARALAFFEKVLKE